MQRRRITLGVGQALQVGTVKIVFVRDNANGTILLDVAGPAAPTIDRQRRSPRPSRTARTTR